MEQEKDNAQASSDWDDIRSEIQNMIKTLKSAEEERKEALSHLSDDLEKTRRELEEIDKDPERKAAFERMLKTTTVEALTSKQNPMCDA
jgi:hypothetical protein